MTTTLKMNIWVEREINMFGCGISDVEYTHEVMSVRDVYALSGS